MNKPSQPQPPFTDVSPPYELDGYGWALAQARLLREGRFDEIDIENIAEEIESVGRSEKGSAESALRMLMAHILKWRHQPERRSRSWASTIVNQRLAYAQVIEENPSLKAKRDDMLARAYKRARAEASAETGLPLSVFPESAIDWETVLDQTFELPDA